MSATLIAGSSPRTIDPARRSRIDRDRRGIRTAIPAEREIGQRLILDLRFDAGACDATVTDRVEDTVDYARVCEVVSLVAHQRSYRTLEALCTAIADRLLADFESSEVWVKATKPEPPIALPVESVSVEVWRSVDDE